MSINNCDLCLRKKSSSQAPKARFRWRQFLSWKCAYSDRKNTQLQTGAEARLVCNTQTKTMSEGEGSKTLRKEGETVSGSIFLDPVTRGYGLRLRTSREEDEMTISNTLTVRSGRLLTTSTIRWSRLYMTAHSYAVTFHCILINT